MTKEQRFDAVVVGAGVTGLMTAHKLTNMGYSVGLVEKSATVGNGPSAKNEGILHMGTRHALVATTNETALPLVERCQYGARSILQYAPEAISNPQSKTYAAVTTTDVESVI